MSSGTSPTEVIYSLLAHSWSGLLIAAVVATSGWTVVRIARAKGRMHFRWAGIGLYVLAAALGIGSVIEIARFHYARVHYPAPGALVDVGGYRMHLLAQGESHGHPTLVWIPGGHAAGAAFFGHHRIFRSEAHSIVFDRPGSGWSDTGPFPRRTGLEAEELATLLRRAGEHGPFVLIGHSYGGLLAANFARRYPDKVAALILLDALQPDMLAYDRIADDNGFEAMRHVHLEQGILKLFSLDYDPFETLRRSDPRIARLQRQADEYLGEQGAALDAVESNPASDWAAASLYHEFEPRELARSAQQLLVYDGDLGNLPTWIVVPRDEIAALIATADGEPAKQRALRLFQKTQHRYLQLSSNTKLIFAPAGTGHNFPYEAPDFVTSLVRDVLRQTRSSAEPPTLFRNVNVISMMSDRTDPHRDVLVRDGRIARIAAAGTIEPPADALMVDGQGRYLMPGLTEMHGHLPGPDQAQYGQDLLLLFLAHGFTTVRSMLGNPWHLQLRSQAEHHELLAPRLYLAGPSFNGNSVADAEHAISMVRAQAAAGYDFLKLHPGLTLPEFDAIATTAHEQNITFQGHVSEQVGLLHALAAKQRAIDHLDGYLEELAEPRCRRAAEDTGFFGVSIVQCVDEKRIPELVKRTREAGTWTVPTERLLEQWANAPSAQQLQARPSTRYMPPAVISHWIELYRASIEGQNLTRERLHRFIEIRRALLREMYRQHVPIALGTDSPQIFNVPGDSGLEELALFVEIGFTPYDALRTATAAPAEFFHATDQFGTVREGLSADLLLLQHNPLADVRALRELAGVMVRGRWLPRADLDEILATIAAHAAQSTLTSAH